MKILRVHIENFRLLRDITLVFATGERQNLTVIRAANESGKTTLLTALQWALFGDDALPEAGTGYRLSPIDVSAEPPVPIPISVEVDYAISTRTRMQQYRLIRSASEVPQPEGAWNRAASLVSLFNLTPTGAEPLSNPEAHIRPHLPHDLREVFFTDGDRALSFIEGSRADQMKHVEGAIRSLLGFETVESAYNHARLVGSFLNRRIRGDRGSLDELRSVTERVVAHQSRQSIVDKNIKEAEERLARLEDFEREADERLADALRQGNREELLRSLQETRQRRQEAEQDALRAARDHANLFKSELLAKHLLADHFAKAKAQLEVLHSQRQIPSQTIPVLEARLDHASCICGESLDGDTTEGQRRRRHIGSLIEESRAADENREKLTALYYSSQSLTSLPPGSRTWVDDYNDVFERRTRADKRVRDFGGKEAEIDAHISCLPDVDVRQLRAARDQYRSQAKEQQDSTTRLAAERENLRREIEQAEVRRNKLLSKDERGRKIAAELDVAKDLEKLLEGTLATMRTRELKQVSDRMNALFLAMIGADAAEKAIIKRAEITPEFRIIVSGPHGQPLDPSQDLNGASRRALTIAFILALAQVSEVKAPNVIDTPLGMMSGYVKQAVLQVATQRSAQLVLLLTHSEINECEEILDQRVGRSYTLTNPAHYPRILVNNPDVEGSRILLCECSHRNHCHICERRELLEPIDEENA